MIQNWGNQNQPGNSNLNMGWQGSKGSINVGYGHSHNITGGAIAHSEGKTLSRSLGSSMALVSAPDASGVRLTSGNGVTDWQGFAVAPYLSDYTSNNIGLDPSPLPDNVDLPKTNVEVYPTKGAVVKADFATRIGYLLLMTLTRVGGMGIVPLVRRFRC
ncbi:fimbria/pilus outer membrane usher protein [Klebsiella pneumoniae]|uniref:fimbria/pilus outer membrane usher protein n=1 Tax=Klebsiella pneumoniae TaxID=573 RepID=UPI00191BE66C|nr:fimbria/pilus outer membrane usher protein [Klebsiella pneumoniae]MCJ8569095.1 fimbria/pilus outer membrane usher protein [Klebsiella pneumoniae]MCM5751572.1 fimbria/pilus outer membrane usher protein [Klebsiella pneumoniae]MCM6195377.1 fimbria/pilus outer membrane usher protein [Klebsiella pneumoniae]MDE4714696.1 fimbria/pilus outer membrane usher protein [Klebsiella pneumoniae]MDE4722382.1 fimbria/pilus outer membrane usher protein [Klebsiella pneumoniae]